MEKKIKFSIIVPIYKVELYLERCLESIVNQTYSDLEIILVDDESPDNCPQICDNWRVRDSRVKVIHKTNGGLSSARNAGLDIAEGDYVSFVDSDDYIELDLFETMQNIIQIHYPDMISFGIREIWSDHTNEYAIFGDFREVPSQEAMKHLLLCDGEMLSFAWNKVYKRKLIGRHRFIEELKYGEDTPFVYEMLKRSLKYFELGDSKYNYCRREDSLIGYSFEEKHMLSLKAAKIVSEDCCTNFPQFNKEAKSHIFITSFFLMKSLLRNKQNLHKYQDQYIELKDNICSFSLRFAFNHYSKKIILQTIILKINPRVLMILLGNY